MSLLVHCCCLFLFLQMLATAQITNLKDEEFDCPTNVMLIENQCNECYCTNKGELACTIRPCSETADKRREDCEEGTSWLNGCNKCWCITIGTVCTNVTCIT